MLLLNNCVEFTQSFHIGVNAMSHKRHLGSVHEVVCQSERKALTSDDLEDFRGHYIVQPAGNLSGKHLPAFEVWGQLSGPWELSVDEAI